MKHYIATISFDADDDADVKNIVSVGADRMQDCDGNVHIYDTHVEEQTEDQFLVRTADEDLAPCAVCGKLTPNDDLFWENPDLPNSCDLVCETCLPKSSEDVAP